MFGGKVKTFCLAITALLFLGGTAHAHTSGTVEKNCPLCGHAFTCELDMSGTQFGVRLDLKPLGPTAAPWRIPVCPQCRFVLYADEISAEELERCREIVKGEEYRKHASRASYFLLGLLYEGLGKDPLTMGHVFLKASWQEEDEAEKLKEDLERSLSHFGAYLKEPGSKGPTQSMKDDEAYRVAQLLKGELLRRLARFEQAEAHLKKIEQMDGIKGNFMGDIVRYELRLVENRDSRPHDVSEVERSAASSKKLRVVIAVVVFVTLAVAYWLRKRKRISL